MAIAANTFDNTELQKNGSENKPHVSEFRVEESRH